MEQLSFRNFPALAFVRFFPARNFVYLTGLQCKEAVMPSDALVVCTAYNRSSLIGQPQSIDEMSDEKIGGIFCEPPISSSIL
ncbi:MAG: hypothetical protein SOZ90_07230 [Candidatus Faecousia sp.]|nr:hypothetical protein [Candidatus Faecousia sp.]